ncbi:MAG: M14 family metallocarboxypeptidase [Candidatus Sericytochromatia bacterium]
MKWQEEDKKNWFNQQKIQRSYLNEVVSKIHNLKNNFDIEQYGALSQNTNLYPIYIIKSKNQDYDKKTVLITGGVHGYETSGVHGALAFIENKSQYYLDKFNIVCVPCISPWAYETINRWNALAIDPNRSFIKDSPSEECRLFLNAMEYHKIKPFVHFDLHETTDTDNTIFRPALAARDGIEEDFSEIPDGFYVVGDTENYQAEFLKNIIDSVRNVTHIAPPDENEKIIGEPIQQEGVINYPLKKLNLCAGFSDAKYTATTEVYPDSPKVTPENCVDAQVSAIEGGLNFLRSK